MLDVALLAIIALVTIAAVWYFKNAHAADEKSSERNVTRQPDESCRVPGLAPSDAKMGNLSDLGTAGSFHQFLTKLHKDFGPIASFWFGEQQCVSIASPELFKEHTKPFDRPEILFDLFRPLYDGSICYANGEDGKSRRRKYDKYFNHEFIGNYFGCFKKSWSEFVKQWSKLPPETQVPLRQNMIERVVHTLAEAAFGGYFADEQRAKVLQEGYQTCWSEMEKRLDGSFTDEGSQRQQEFEKARQIFFDTMQEAIDEREKLGDVADKEKIFMDAVLESGFPKETMLQDCITYLVAGLHTSGLLLTWAFYYMAMNKAIQDKAYVEIKNNISEEEDITPDKVSSLSYLQQIQDETLRCSILAPYCARVEQEDITLGGYTIPAGVPVMQATGVVLQDPVIWPEPGKFDPERFSPESFKSIPKYAFEPFGFSGKRKCPGYRFAYAETAVALVLVLRKFEIVLVPGQKVEKVFGLVTTPKEDMLITLKERL